METNDRSLPPILTLANAAIAANERQFPKHLGPVRKGGEDEMRLFYVASTRTKEELVLCDPLVARDRDCVDVILEPSRFISELPDASFQRWQVQEGEAPAELPEGGRYRLPGFLGDGNGVN